MREMSRADRRTYLILNYMSLAAVVLLVDMRGVLGWGTLPIATAACAALVLGLTTFIRVFWQTGLWRTTHAGFKGLDERQVQVVYGSLMSSYSIFAVVCLVILYANALIARGHIPIVLAGAVLYFAHTLPAAVVASRWPPLRTQAAIFSAAFSWMQGSAV